MYEAEEIFGLIPEGYFDDAESFVDYVNSNGIEEFWDFMPEGYWDTKEDFLAGLKKKRRERWGFRIGSWFIGATYSARC